VGGPQEIRSVTASDIWLSQWTSGGGGSEEVRVLEFPRRPNILSLQKLLSPGAGRVISYHGSKALRGVYGCGGMGGCHGVSGTLAVPVGRMVYWLDIAGADDGTTNSVLDSFVPDPGL
jgi:hypothetical protein